MLSHLLWLLCFGWWLRGSSAELRNGSCPEDVGKLNGCVCEVWLSGLKIVCSRTDFPTLRGALTKADLPISVLRLRETRGFDGRLPNFAFGGLLVRELDLASNGLRDIGLDALTAQKDSLRLLVLANNSLPLLPNLRSFEKLQVLDATGNSLSFLSELHVPPNLTQLRLKRNNICALVPNAFANSKQSLVLLDLADNCFRSVPSLTLRGAPKLAFLDLSRNQMLGELGFQALADLPALRELRLEGNPLTRLGPMSFLNLPNLQHLSFRSSTLQEFTRGVFTNSSMPALSILDLSGNRITKMAAGSLEGLGSLRQALLDGNRVRVLERGAVVGNPSLQLLSMQNNSMESLESGALQDLPSLLILHLANNSLRSLDRDALSDLPGLQQLSLARNNIAHIHPTAFRGLPKLNIMDLAGNKLQELSPGVLDPLEALDYLDLRNNSIQSFPNGSLSRRIPNLLLTGNPLNCDREPVTYLLGYLSRHIVRTSAPKSPPLICASPEKYKGMDLKDLVARRANETFFQGINDLLPGGFQPGGVGAQLPLAGLLPSLDRIPGLPSVGIPGLNAPIPGLNTVARAIPGFANLPGVNALVNPSIASPGDPEGLIQSFSSLTRPLSRLVAGEKASANDLQELLTSLPRLAQEIPAAMDIDVSKVSPEIFRAFISGDDIPGLPIPAATRELITRRVLSQMANAAAAANKGQSTLANGTPIDQLLPPPSSLPAETVKSVLQGQVLPTLNERQTLEIRNYYTQRILRDGVVATPDKATRSGKPSNEVGKLSEPSNGQPESLPVTELLGVLSPKDLSLVPDSLISDIANRRPLDLSTLPEALVNRVRTLDPALADRIQQINERNLGRAKEASPINRSQPPAAQSFAVDKPMNLENLRTELVDPDASDEGVRLLMYSLIVVAVLALLTGLTVAFLCWRRFVAERKKSRLLLKSHGPDSLREFMPNEGDPMRRDLSQPNISVESARDVSTPLPDHVGHPFPPSPFYQGYDAMNESWRDVVVTPHHLAAPHRNSSRLMSTSSFRV